MSPVVTPAVSQPSFIKMEDRKRSAAQDDFAPPTKRQAVNGSKGSTDSDLPWAKDLEVSRSHDRKAYPLNLSIFFLSRFRLKHRLLLGDGTVYISGYFCTISVGGANVQLAMNSILDLRIFIPPKFTHLTISRSPASVPRLSR